ncbi:hypothetical protein CAAN1_03S00408 [[Candida] anglica]|uniref:Serine aminopeptidase S33 domain-containing protein n=1 Tax=[Candida] anglica TaxID=148631 RepID=A0ABP0EGH0_9ASCO
MFATSSLIFVKILAVLRGFAQVSISVGALALLGLYTYQSSLIYPASLNEGHGHCATPEEYDMPYEAVELTTSDSVSLQCYSLKHDPSAPNYTNKTVVVLSPNAGNIGHAMPIVQILYREFGYNVFIYSYRGYGKSSGSPSEKGLKLDAQRVMDYLTTEDEQFAASSLVLYGRSLGSAVAIYIGATMSSSVHAIILENAFLSIRKTVPHIFPFLKWFTACVHQVWDSESLVGSIPKKIPVLLLSARRDEIVPPSHMDAIYELLNSEDKTLQKFESSMHNDTVVQPRYWEIVHEFIQDKVNPVGY